MDVAAVVMACREKAQAQGLSLAQVGQKAGVSKSQVGNWFHGRRMPSAPNLLALISAVGLSLELVDQAAPRSVLPTPKKPATTKTATAMVQATTATARSMKATPKPAPPKKAPPKDKKPSPWADVVQAEIKRLRTETAKKNSLRRGDDAATLTHQH